MKEAYGGVFNMIFIVIFLVVAIGVLGLTFSYTKAFKMKNAVIAAIEEYEGNINHEGCKEKIKESAADLGYRQIPSCPSDLTLSPDQYYCYKLVKDESDKVVNPSYKLKVYTVMVQVDIGIPLIKQIVGFSLFQVSGDTKEIKVRITSP